MSTDSPRTIGSSSVVIHRRTRWFRNNSRELTEFSVSSFHFHEETHGHISLETQPASSRFTMVPASFLKFRLLLLGMAKRNSSVEFDLNTLEEQNLRPHGPIRRSWVLKWRMSPKHTLSRFFWIGKTFPAQLWLNLVRELRTMPEPEALDSIDLPILISGKHLPFLPEYYHKNGFLTPELLDSLPEKADLPEHYRFRGWHPRFGLILRKEDDLFAFSGELPPPSSFSGSRKQTCFAEHTLWCPDLWIEASS